MKEGRLILTAGHSTLSQDAFLELVVSAGVELLWDVRSYPTSRWEWFRRERLEAWLPAAGVEYRWVPALGGRRSERQAREARDRLAPLLREAGGSPPAGGQGWQEPGFAAYQWHMTTEEFLAAADELVALDRPGAVAIMCSEGPWWRCHRSMIADYLVTAGAEVTHLQPRRLDHAAVVEERLLRYDPAVPTVWRRHLDSSMVRRTSPRLPDCGNNPCDRGHPARSVTSQPGVPGTPHRRLMMGDITRITEVRTVAVPVTDQDRALDFYVGKLGFEKRMDATFGGGRRWIEVAPSGSATTIALAPLPREGVAGVDTGIRLATRDAEGDHAQLLARGVDADPEVLHFEGAPPMFSLRDPDGNLLYVVEQMEQAA